MKEKLKSFLIKNPALYQSIQGFYYKLQCFKAKILGTRQLEKHWRKYPFNLERAFKNLNHPHRQILIEKISCYQPFSKVLEFGCSYGPNLYLLAKKFPEIKFVGIDINPVAIKEGKEWLLKERVSNIELLTGEITNLFQFPDKNFDIVLTDAVLMCIGPDKIKEAIKELIRLAQKALILIEWYIENKEKEYDAHVGVWKYNYVNLLKEFIPEKRIFLTKITPKMWPDKNWQKWGYIIEIKL